MGIQAPQSINLSLVALNGVLRSGNGSVLDALYYPDGFFAESVMPMKMVRPAPPEAMEGFFSPDHYGYVGRQTEIRIAVQGGAYPYVPVIVSAPPGATIGTDPNDFDNYLVLRFTPTENGVQQIELDVFDQHRTKLVISYPFTTDESWCAFISTEGSDVGGDGTKNLPWASVDHAFATATGGKCLIVENGTYTGISLGRYIGSASIGSIIAWEQLGVIFDWTDNAETALGASFYLAGSNIIIQGIKFNNPQTACASPRIFTTNSVVHYVIHDNCEFNINGRVGTVNNDNVSCLFFGDAGPSHTHFAQTRCKFTGFAGLTNGWSAFDTYRTSWGVFECNRLSDQRSVSSSAGMIWPKGVGSKNIDIRNNVFESAMGGALIDVYIGNAVTSGTSDGVTGNIDVSYNLIRAIGNAGVWVGRSSQDGARLPVWCRRNTIIDGVVVIFARDFEITFYSDSDVIQSSISSSDPFKVVVRHPNDSDNVYRPLSYVPSLIASVVNYECHQNSVMVDENGILIGELASFRGQRGHEIWRPE